MTKPDSGAASPNLFGVVKKPKRKSPALADPQTLQHLIGLYVTLFDTAYHEKPIILKRDGAMLKRLLTSFGVTQVEARLRAYFDLQEPFLKDERYPLSLLEGRWNKLGGRVPSANTVDQAAKTELYLRKLRGGTSDDQ